MDKTEKSEKCELEDIKAIERGVERVIDLLEEMYGQGRISYDVYSELWDMVDGIIE